MTDKLLFKLIAVVLASMLLLSFVGCELPGASPQETSLVEDAAAETTLEAEASAEATEAETSTTEAEVVDENQKDAIADADKKAEEYKKELRKSEFPLTVEDSLDRKVTFEKKVEKVISLGPNMTEIIFALGAGDRLVGRTDYCDYPEEAKEIPSVGTLMEPNLELIIEKNPEVVLASTHVSEDFVAKLEEVGIPVLFLYSEYEIDKLDEIFLTIGQILDLNQEAADLTADVFSRLEYVKELVDDAEEPTVYYVVGFGESGDFSAGKKTFINDLMDYAGVKNIAADTEGWTYSVESLIEKDPDYILIPAWADGEFQKAEPYKNLTAVKEGRVIVVDENIFNRQGPRVADAVEFLAEALHPELYVSYKKVA